MVNIAECCFSTEKQTRLSKTIWLLTLNCPWKCGYCVVNRSRKSYIQLPLKDNLLILDKLQKLGIINLVLTGGEPLLLKEDILALVDRAREFGMKFSLSTTGKPKDIFIKILERLPKKINLSLDANNSEVNEKERGQGSYQNALEIFKLLNEKNIPTHITCVLTRFNYRNIKSILTFIKENPHNITGLSVQNQYPVGKGELDFPLIFDELVLVFQELKKHSVDRIPTVLVNAPDINYPLQKCPGGSSLFSIFPDGTYTPCPFLLDTSDNFNLGNILNEASEVISAKLRNFVSDIDSELKKLSSSTPTCLKCSERNNCGLGCYVLRVVHEQNYKKPSLRCKKIARYPKFKTLIP